MLTRMKGGYCPGNGQYRHGLEIYALEDSAFKLRESDRIEP